MEENIEISKKLNKYLNNQILLKAILKKIPKLWDQIFKNDYYKKTFLLSAIKKILCDNEKNNYDENKIYEIIFETIDTNANN